MKLRAPRCRDSVSLMSAPEGSSAISPSSAMAAPADRSATVINTQLLSMSRDPLRYRLHAVEFRVPGHQQKKGEVQNRADFGQHRVNARGRFQAADTQANE